MSEDLDRKLTRVYEVIMSMAEVNGGFLKSARALRGGYTHWIGPELAREIRRFDGMVSRAAIENGTHIGLVAEHFHKIQTNLTKLIDRHLEEGQNALEFVEAVKRMEEVRITTKAENYELGKKLIGGEYSKAGIELVSWQDVPDEARIFLRKKLTQCANRDQFI